jgi:hypothetical protein
MQWLSLKRKKRSPTALADRARDSLQRELATQLYAKALDRNPRNPAIRVQYRHVLKECGELRDPEKLVQAKAAHRRALSLDPGVADTHPQFTHFLKLQGKDQRGRSLRPARARPEPGNTLSTAGIGWARLVRSSDGRAVNRAQPHTK